MAQNFQKGRETTIQIDIFWLAKAFECEREKPFKILSLQQLKITNQNLFNRLTQLN